jgi:two-component system response regulator PilR (NtrC family)
VATKHQVLVVDDELSMRELLEIVLQGSGYEVTCAASVDEAVGLLGASECDLVLTDLHMGSDRQAGLRLLAWLKDNTPGTPAIMITAHGTIETAVEAMRLGAADYIQKPFKSNDEIRLRVRRAIAERNLRRENEALRTEQARRARLDGMVGKSPAFLEVASMIRRVAGLPSTIAIHGESGVGKELVARALHSLSSRADSPFVAINCGGIPETLLESELFGYKKGAFTGAAEDKEGLFVVANGGSILLDEIGEMPMMLQVKLLRVLDNNTITPVGGTTAVHVDVRIISATNRDLEAMVDRGEFRKDLYYRLNVIPLYVPPLRNRYDDIPLLAQHLIRKHADNMGCLPKELSAQAVGALLRYPWPGNVRELGNVIERALALSTEEAIELHDLPPVIREYTPEPARAEDNFPPAGIDLESLVAGIEMDYIRQALERTHYSQLKAASLLGMTPRSLRYRLQKHGLNAD